MRLRQADILSFCEDATRFLAQDPRNVIALHCKGGKGELCLKPAC